MSHAYVEVEDVAVAGRVLRGEGGGLDGEPDTEGNDGGTRVGKPRERGSVLGKGRRARGVTITRCGQEELMADVGVPSVDVFVFLPLIPTAYCFPHLRVDLPSVLCYFRPLLVWFLVRKHAAACLR